MGQSYLKYLLSYEFAFEQMLRHDAAFFCAHIKTMIFSYHENTFQGTKHPWNFKPSQTSMAQPRYKYNERTLTDILYFTF